MMIEVYRYLSKGWVSDYWISPQYLFNYPGFYFLEALPGDGMIYLFWRNGCNRIFHYHRTFYKTIMPIICFGIFIPISIRSNSLSQSFLFNHAIELD